eukprot:305978_1
MPRNNNKNKKKRAASPCIDSSSTTPITSPPSKKAKKNDAKAIVITNIEDVQPKVSGGSLTCVGQFKHTNNDRETKNHCKYLRAVFHDKTADIEINSKRNRDIHKRAIDNGSHFKMEFNSSQLKKQSNPRYNVGRNKFIVYDPMITQLTKSEQRKWQSQMGMKFDFVNVENIKDQDEDTKIDICVKVLGDEIKSYTKFNRSWKSRKFQFGDVTGGISYFSDDLKFKIPSNGIVALQNAGVEKNGEHTNLVGGHLVDEETMNEYLQEEVNYLLNNIENIKSCGFVFKPEDFIECNIRKFLQKRKEVFTTQKEINEDYLKIVITSSIVSLDNPSNCTYYSRKTDFKSIDTNDLDDFEDSEIIGRYKLELEWTDSSKKHFDMMLWDANAIELLGKTAGDFMKLSDKKQQKIIDNLSGLECELYIISKYETSDNGVLSLKSKICKLIKQ